MLHNWFTCKIRYEKTLENGMNKKVTEPYLVDALSFTEAEARIIEEMAPYISGEFEVADVTKAKISEIFWDDRDTDEDYWFKCKMCFITLNENSGEKKKTHQYILVQAKDFRDAVSRVDECMKGCMADYIITSLSETGIIDVFKYEADSDTKPEFAEE